MKTYLDPDHPDVNESRIQKFNWEDFYKGAEETIPNNVPEVRGRAIGLHCFVDADHASDKVTHRSQTGIINFGNRAPLAMFRKRQNSVQTSNFRIRLFSFFTGSRVGASLKIQNSTIWNSTGRMWSKSLL